jgi:hypothetical protein
LKSDIKASKIKIKNKEKEVDEITKRETVEIDTDVLKLKAMNIYENRSNRKNKLDDFFEPVIASKLFVLLGGPLSRIKKDADWNSLPKLNNKVLDLSSLKEGNFLNYYKNLTAEQKNTFRKVLFNSRLGDKETQEKLKDVDQLISLNKKWKKSGEKRVVVNLNEFSSEEKEILKKQGTVSGGCVMLPYSYTKDQLKQLRKEKKKALTEYEKRVSAFEKKIKSKEKIKLTEKQVDLIVLNRMLLISPSGRVPEAWLTTRERLKNSIKNEEKKMKSDKQDLTYKKERETAYDELIKKFENANGFLIFAHIDDLLYAGRDKSRSDSTGYVSYKMSDGTTFKTVEEAKEYLNKRRQELETAKVQLETNKKVEKADTKKKLKKRIEDEQEKKARLKFEKNQLKQQQYRLQEAQKETKDKQIELEKVQKLRQELKKKKKKNQKLTKEEEYELMKEMYEDNKDLYEVVKETEKINKKLEKELEKTKKIEDIHQGQSGKKFGTTKEKKKQLNYDKKSFETLIKVFGEHGIKLEPGNSVLEFLKNVREAYKESVEIFEKHRDFVDNQRGTNWEKEFKKNAGQKNDMKKRRAAARTRYTKLQRAINSWYVSNRERFSLEYLNDEEIKKELDFLGKEMQTTATKLSRLTGFDKDGVYKRDPVSNIVTEKIYKRQEFLG